MNLCRTEFEDQLTIAIRYFKEDLVDVWDFTRYLCDEVSDREMRLIERLTDILFLCQNNNRRLPDKFIDELKRDCLVFLHHFCNHIYNKCSGKPFFELKEERIYFDSNNLYFTFKRRRVLFTFESRKKRPIPFTRLDFFIDNNITSKTTSFVS